MGKYMQKIKGYLTRNWEGIVAGIIGTVIFTLGQNIFNSFGEFTKAFVNMSAIYSLLLWLVFSIGISFVVFNLLHLLRRLRGFRQIVGRRFVNQVVEMDGKHFINCVFENCTMVLGGGEFRYTNMRYEGQLFVEFQNPVVSATVDFMKNMKMLKEDDRQSFMLAPKDRVEKGFPIDAPMLSKPTESNSTVKKNNRKRPKKIGQ